MQQQRSRRLAGLALASGLLCLAPAPAGAAERVTVRVEGAQRTLARASAVTTSAHRTVGLPGQGTCAGTSGLAALDAAVGGSWSGSYDADFGDYLIRGIRGERHPAGATGADYWSVWLNHREAQVGLCQLRPRSRDELLVFPSRFPAPKGGLLPLGLSAPARARAGRAFAVKVVQYAANGRPTPVRDALVRGGGHVSRTNALGFAKLRFLHGRRVTVRATKANRIRSEHETVDVR